MSPLPARLAACELCAAGPEALRTSVLVQHARGGSIQFDVCDRCATAVRRLIAVAGASTASGSGQIVVDANERPSAPDTETVAPDVVGEPVIILEFTEPFRADDGVLYAVRAYGQCRADGTWIGWLAFIGSDDLATRRTARETTQSNRDHLAYWASGLQQSYLDGAFNRAN